MGPDNHPFGSFFLSSLVNAYEYKHMLDPMSEENSESTHYLARRLAEDDLRDWSSLSSDLILKARGEVPDIFEATSLRSRSRRSAKSRPQIFEPSESLAVHGGKLSTSRGLIGGASVVN